MSWYQTRPLSSARSTRYGDEPAETGRPRPQSSHRTSAGSLVTNGPAASSAARRFRSGSVTRGGDTAHCQVEGLTANLISVNRRYKAHAGVRITDV